MEYNFFGSLPNIGLNYGSSSLGNRYLGNLGGLVNPNIVGTEIGNTLGASVGAAINPNINLGANLGNGLGTSLNSGLGISSFTDYFTNRGLPAMLSNRTAGLDRFVHPDGTTSLLNPGARYGDVVNDSITPNSGLNRKPTNTWTGADWANIASAGVQLVGSLGNLWMQNKGYKLAKQQIADQTALNRANYKMQAKAWNNSQKDIASGRGLAVMSSSQKSALGRQARDRLIEETY